MENKKEKLEDFKTAVSSTVKSISNSDKIIVSFGNQISKSEKNSINLPSPHKINNKINYDEIRAIADSKSLNFRFSNLKTFKKFEPKGNISKKLYEIAEKIRCEKIGVQYFKGIKKNIEKFYKSRISELDLKKSEDKIIESFENYLRVKFFDSKNNKELDQLDKAEKVVLQVIDQIEKHEDYGDIIFNVGRCIYECKNDDVSTPSQKSKFAKFRANKSKELQNQLLISELRKVVDLLNENFMCTGEEAVKKLNALRWDIKDRKVIVFKKRRRQNSRKRYGHRQPLSKVQITKIMSKNGKVVAQISNDQIKLSSGKVVEKKLSSKKTKNVKKVVKNKEKK
mgnify:CR=1 FL=1